MSDLDEMPIDELEKVANDKFLAQLEEDVAEWGAEVRKHLSKADPTTDAAVEAAMESATTQQEADAILREAYP